MLRKTLTRKYRNIQSTLYHGSRFLPRLKRQRVRILLICSLALFVCLVLIQWVINIGLFRQNVRKHNLQIKSNVHRLVIDPENEEVCEVVGYPRSNLQYLFTQNSDETCEDESSPEWVRCSRSKCSIDSKVIAMKGKITCDFTDILWKNDYEIDFGRTYRSSQFYLLEMSNYVKMNCSAASGEIWLGIGAGTRMEPSPKLNSSLLSPDELQADEGRPKMNVVLLSLGALSKNGFKVAFPRTYRHMTKNLKMSELNGYNILGDDPAKNFIPLLTRHAEFELEDSRRGLEKAVPFKTSRFIFQLYKYSDYETGFNEDNIEEGIFTKRHLGFATKPTDHYLRMYFIAAKEIGLFQGKECIGSRPRYKILLDYIKDILWKNPNKAKFLVNIHSLSAGDSYCGTAAMDEYITTWFKDLEKMGILDSTVFLVMSDRGGQFLSNENTLEEKLEERTPFVSFIIPASFKARYPLSWDSLQENTNRLSTPYDIYATLMTLLNLKKVADDDLLRSFSLLSKMPPIRSCSDAFIEPQWCACGSWEHVSNRAADLAAYTMLERINEATLPFRAKCAEFTLIEVSEVTMLKYQTGLLKFKGNKDGDGYDPDWSGNSVIRERLFRVKIAVLPGWNFFEGNVTFDEEEKSMRCRLDDIARVVRPGMKSKKYCLKNIPMRLYDYCLCVKIKL